MVLEPERTCKHKNISLLSKGIIDLLQVFNVFISALHTDQNVRTSQDSSSEGSGKKGGLLSRPFGFGWNDKNKVGNFSERVFLTFSFQVPFVPNFG